MSVTEIIRMISGSFSSHDPVVIPTDTIYGLAVPFDDDRAVQRIFEIKGRPAGKPLAVCIPDIGSVSIFSDPSKEALDIIGRTAPGPFTYILPAVEGLPPYIVKEGKVALRLPDNDLILEVAGKLGPLALTSSNISGEGGADTAETVSRDLSDHDLLIIEDDEALSGEASEVVDLTGDRPRVFRGGKIKINELLREG